MQIIKCFTLSIDKLFECAYFISSQFRSNYAREKTHLFQSFKIFCPNSITGAFELKQHDFFLKYLIIAICSHDYIISFFLPSFGLAEFVQSTIYLVATSLLTAKTVRHARTNGLVLILIAVIRQIKLQFLFRGVAFNICNALAL